jgi:hypothetical protein
VSNIVLVVTKSSTIKLYSYKNEVGLGVLGCDAVYVVLQVVTNVTVERITSIQYEVIKTKYNIIFYVFWLSAFRK